MKIQDKREREKRIVTEMIRLYCRKNHHSKTLCAECIPEVSSAANANAQSITI